MRPDERVVLIDLENMVGTNPRTPVLRSKVTALLEAAGPYHHAVVAYAASEDDGDTAASVLAALGVAPLRVEPGPDAAENALIRHASRMQASGCTRFHRLLRRQGVRHPRRRREHPDRPAGVAGTTRRDPAGRHRPRHPRTATGGQDDRSGRTVVRASSTRRWRSTGAAARHRRKVPAFELPAARGGIADGDGGRSRASVGRRGFPTRPNTRPGTCPSPWLCGRPCP